MNQSIKHGVGEAEKQAEKAMPGSHWLETLARIGYFAKGVVYAFVGILAVGAAFSMGTDAAGPQEALQEIADQPYGMVMLGIIGFGLLCYASWRFILATLDPKDLGMGSKSLVKRLGFVGSGIANASLSLAAFKIMAGSSSGGDSQEQWVSEFVFTTVGQILVIAAGLIIIGVGLRQVYRAYDASFVEKFGRDMSQELKSWALWIGRVGLSARAVAFVLIGGFLVSAGWFQDPEETGDMSDALETMQQNELGQTVLPMVAIGFVCYSVYCFFYAYYRRFETNV